MTAEETAKTEMKAEVGPPEAETMEMGRAEGDAEGDAEAEADVEAEADMEADVEAEDADRASRIKQRIG